MTIRILLGDCRDVLKTLPDASVDSIVTDPPYELGFMGKSWDSTGIANSVEMWREALRVLKPGGHLLAFSGTRTYHRMVCAIEDAGFDIRDQIGWVYGSGFPKSLDVSKAIDKARVEDKEPVRAVCRAVRAAMDFRGLTASQMTQHFGDCHSRLVDHWAARDTDSQPSLPTWAQWQVLRAVLAMDNEHDAEVIRLNARKGESGDVYQSAEIIGAHGRETPGFVGKRFNVVDNKIRARSEQAEQWAGWGTALKPAWESIVVARKPLIGTVAANVLAHGTGALNIDGCRVGAFDGIGTARKPVLVRNTPTAFGHSRAMGGNGSVLGRWPANLIHDGSDEVLAVFPQAPGQLADASNSDTPRAAQNVYGAMRRGRGAEASANSANEGAVGFAMKPGARRLDAGRVARFFYTAKASRHDRSEGLQTVSEGGRNSHPTVKPTDLMRYLCRLVTPPGGVVLDPFMGSGSTLKAAELEGFSAIGIELDPAYVEIARRRIASDAPLFAEVTA